MQVKRGDKVNTYHQFRNYLQENYMETVKGELAKFLTKKQRQTNIKENIHEIKITNIKFTKSKKDRLSFCIYFYARFHLTHPFIPSSLEIKKAHFKLSMKGSFQSGFTPISFVQMDKQNDKLSDTLVPIIHANELDKYATLFLKHSCPEAIDTPTKIDAHEIVEKLGLTVYFAPLDSNIFAKIYFTSTSVDIYEDETSDDTIRSIVQKDIQPGTILVNRDKTKERPSGSYRNTIIHEAVHWFFHRKYFELRHLLDHKETCMTCYINEDMTTQNEITWMEWQARNLTPRILMPKKMALKNL